jgi:undecaprenyl pyrophosphate phosphatase UppP
VNNAATSLSLAYSIILAVIQGLTEFLPVSSSGHLAAVQLIWTLFSAMDRLHYSGFHPDGDYRPWL